MADETRSMQPFLEFLGLREQPFAATADPVYFYATRAHKECLFRLWNSIDERHGIAVILGHYGTGKTTLLRKLMIGMAADPERYNTAVVGSPIPSWTSFALLENIVRQFGLEPPKRSFMSYMETLNRYLTEHRDCINTLIIDDAQNLNKRGQIELLRLVQNLETDQHKLLNLVLFAQMEWAAILKAAPNFEQRINTTFTLPPLTLDETREFIEFRLRQGGAGANAGQMFDESAIRAIHAYTEGSPRVTVTLCRNSLLVAAWLRTKRVTQDIILHTIDKTTLPDREKRLRVVTAINAADKEVGPEQSPETEQLAPEAEARDLSGDMADSPMPVPQGSSTGQRREHERLDRASRLLLRAAQARRGRSHGDHGA